MEMNKNIFQIFISDENNPSDLSEQLMDRTEKVKSVYGDYKHTLYTNSMLQDFLSDFDKETLDSYNKIKPYAFKADIARYCLLYKYGGWYFDMSLTPEFKLEFDESVDALLFKNSVNYSENCIMYFKPKSNYLMDCIKQINFHIFRNYYGKHATEITGPKLLKRIHERYEKNYFINYKFGNFVDLSYLQCVCEYDNKIFAKYKYPNVRGLKHLGCKGVNNYELMWKNEDVYEY